MKAALYRRLGDNKPAGVLAVIALCTTYPLLFVAALPPSPAAFAVVAAGTYVAEPFALRTAPYVVSILSRVHVGITTRFLLRVVAVATLGLRLGAGTRGLFVAVTTGLVALQGARVAYSGLALYVSRRRRLPMVTRNVDLSALRIPDGPAGWLVEGHVRRFLYLDVPALAGLMIAVLTGADAVAAAGLTLSLLGAALGVGLMVHHARRARVLSDRDRLLRLVNDQVTAYRPEVVLYFSGSLDSTYQVNMWLSTLERMHRRSLIIMRERALVPLLGRTSIPVVCLPSGVDMMNFELPTVRVGLFVSNVGKNIHLLRVPGIKHVFIGHGDSDKEASFNPFSKVYDEVWVAGRAGRDRYLRAGVGVEDDDIVEVGRPQLASIATRPAAGPMRTVLYAPTWEGWTDDLQHSSLADMGPAIVRALLDRSPEIRVLYKPHPLTGTRDPRAARAHRQIVSMLRAANAAREASGEWSDRSDVLAAQPEHPEQSAQSAQSALTIGPGPVRRLTALLGRAGADPDEARLSRDSGRADPAHVADSADSANIAERERLEAERDEAYWAAEGWWRHRVITDTRPTLYECFNRCDALVSDISSVVADFVASQKPYVVSNVANLPEERFRDRYPTAAAAYPLDRDCATLPEILNEIEKDGPDRLAARRHELKTYLLGPDSPDALTRFGQAVDRLIDGD
jgi:hypothetical protein